MDPRKPRPNPEIPEILRAIKSTHADLQKAKTYKQRKGYARILRAHLQMFDEEPESITDLQEGVAEITHWLAPENMPEVSFLEQGPFDEGGPSSGVYFFLTSQGLISHLHSGPPVDPYKVQECWRHGPFVHSVEKVFCSEKPTTHHFPDQTVLQRYTGAKRGEKKPYLLLSDPRGSGDGRAVLIRSYATESSACRAAERLSGKFDIRFLVGKNAITFLNR